MKDKKKKPKPKFVDDGRTVASMDYEHLTGYKSAEERERHNRLRETNLTKEERRAIYKASFAKFLPPFLCFVAAFAVVLVLIYVFALN